MNIHRHILFLLLATFLSTSVFAQSLSPNTKTSWKKGTLVVKTPKRQKGQQHVLGLTVPKIPMVRVAFVGLGMRGPGAVERFTHIPGVEIVALCDYEKQRAEACQKYLRAAGLPPASVYGGERGYEDVCKRTDIDLVYIATDWHHHFPVAKCAMQNGKHAAIEVPAAMNLAQCWELINLSEQKRVHCIMLENCCYDWYEMTVLNMTQQGVFGEVLRAEGAYIHNLDPFWDSYWKAPGDNDPEGLGWRLLYNKENRGDIYATHGLGPVAQALDIHRGDHFVTLVAMDTKSVHGRRLVEKKTGKDCPDFRNGDHTTTLLRTARGRVVEIQHNVMTYQPYNRLYKITGEKGYATKYPEQRIALDGGAMQASGVPQVDKLDTHSFMSSEQQQAFMEKYTHPILTRYGEMARKVGGHGGMDFIMDARLVYCLHNGLPLDMDVYDLAEWCALAELGSLSMDHNSCSVAFPDFTRGYQDVQKGFRHAFATPEDERAAEMLAETSTQEQKERAVREKLWEKYDKEHESTH